MENQSINFYLAALSLINVYYNKTEGIIERVLIGASGFLCLLGWIGYCDYYKWSELAKWSVSGAIFVFFAIFVSLPSLVIRPSKKKRRILTMDQAIIVLSWGMIGFVLFSSAALIYQSYGTQKVPSAKEIAQALSGVGNYSYFFIYRINDKPQLSKDGYQLALNGEGVVEKANIWFHPASAPTPNGMPNDPYYSLRHLHHFVEIIHAGGRAWITSLPLGEYLIDFATRNGNWIEFLKIYESNGDVKEIIKVTNTDGKVLFESPKDTKLKKGIKKQ